MTVFAGEREGGVKRVNIAHWICGVEAMFKCQRPGVFQCWLQLVCTSSNWTYLLLLQAVGTGAGDSSCKDRGKNQFSFEPFCFVRECDIHQQPCLLPPPHPVFTETKALAAPSSAAFPFCPSVAAELSGSFQLIEIEWNSNKTAGHSYGLDFGVVWKHLFVHSLQTALQQNSLIHRGSLSSLCRCGFSHKSGIQQHVVKLPKLSLVVSISRNSRQEQFFICCFITYLL